MELGSVPVSHVRWAPSYRIIPSRFPPIDLFERVLDPADFDAAYELEAMTNDRLRDELGEITLVPPEERVYGAGAGYIMAAFTHPSPFGGRFTDGTYGAYYAGADRATAVAETVYHRQRFLRESGTPALEIGMRVLHASLSAEMHDLRSLQSALPEVYSPDHYGAAQAFGREIRSRGSDGIVYDSVRNPGGTCAAVFRPRVLSRCNQAEHLGYVWNGERITVIYEKRILRS
jgi:hypothetical protein